jgi:hypothetical protein
VKMKAKITHNGFLSRIREIGVVKIKILCQYPFRNLDANYSFCRPYCLYNGI